LEREAGGGRRRGEDERRRALEARIVQGWVFWLVLTNDWLDGGTVGVGVWRLFVAIWGFAACESFLESMMVVRVDFDKYII
jgi:hypothetical protein